MSSHVAANQPQSMQIEYSTAVSKWGACLPMVCPSAEGSGYMGRLL